MKKYKFLLIGMVLCTVGFFCRKIDQVLQKQNKPDIEKDFFTKHPTTDKSVQAVQNYMKNQELQYHFIDDLVSRIGMPYWNKSLVFQDISAHSRSDDGDTAMIICIPFVKDSAEQVNAGILVRMTDADTSWRGVCDWQYANFGFDTTVTTKWISRDVFSVFASMDNSVFGYTKWDMKDWRIWGKTENDTIQVTLDTITYGHNRTYGRPGSASISTFCNQYRICSTVYRGFRAHRPESEECWHETRCTTIWISGGGYGWNWGEPPPGGGGGGGNPWIPPVLPPECQGARNLTNPNPCNGGWIPNPGGGNQIPTPNDSLLSARLKRLYEKGGNRQDSLIGLAMSDELERTFTFNRMPPNQDTVAAFIKTGSEYLSIPTVFPNSFAVWHCHQDGGPNSTNKNQCFDGADIYYLYRTRSAKNIPLEVSFITTRDYIYAAIITDGQKFKNYIDSLTGHPADIDVLGETLDAIHRNAWNNCNCSWQEGSEQGTLTITANNNSNVSGIRIFRSPRQNINFTPLIQQQ